MIIVNYSMLDSLLQSRRMSRRQLAVNVGLSVDTLSASFRRHSRMKIDSVWKIADALSVSPASLVVRSGYATDEAYQADLKAVTNGRSDHDVMVEDTQILEILRLLRVLNASGLRQAVALSELLTKVPEYRKTQAELMADQERTEEAFSRRMLQAEREENEAELYSGLDDQRQEELLEASL